MHHRSDSLPPYVYEHPHFGYPVAHSIDHSVGSSSKQLVIVSFIGLLLLFAIIQNTIAAVKRRDIGTDVLSAREKRDIYASYDLNSVVKYPFDLSISWLRYLFSCLSRKLGNFLSISTSSDSGAGRRSQRRCQGALHTEDSLRGESKARESFRCRWKNARQVLDVSPFIVIASLTQRRNLI